MTSTIYAQGNYPFGQMTNQLVGRLIGGNSQMVRLQDAIATASSGYGGVPGTEFEAPVTGNQGPLGNPSNLFGVVPVADEPGKAGTDYAYAVNSLATAWATFWATAEPYIEQLDNGSG